MPRILFKKIEQGTKDLAEKSDLDRKQALVKLNDLAKEMEKRRDKLADDEKLKQQFKQLKDMQQGPADKVSKALKNGDFKEAVKQIDDLKQKLANGDLGEKEKEQLAKQIDQMRQTLEKQAEAREQAKQELQKQVDQARQAGRTDDAQKAQQQLDKLNQECEKCSKMSDLAKQLDQAAKGLKQGDAKAAQAVLDKVSDQLQDMQQSSEEMAMLDQALDELAEAKNSMDCKNCNGQGFAQCQGKGQGQGQPKKQGPPGNGLGKGARPGRPARAREQDQLLRFERPPECRQGRSGRHRSGRGPESQGRSARRDQVFLRKLEARGRRSAHRSASAARIPRARQDLLRRDPRGAEVNPSLTPALGRTEYEPA